MDAAAFAKWLATSRLLNPAQRKRAFRELASAEANSPAKASDHKTDEAVPSVAIKTIADKGLGQSLPPNNGQGQTASAGCPYCGGDDVYRWGTVSGKPRYRCKGCQKTFNALTGTPLAHLRYRERWQDQIQALIDGEPLAKAAERCNVHISTAFRWRHRFLAAADLAKIPEVPGISGADGAFILESFETHRSDMGMRIGPPRGPRTGGGKNGRRGRPKKVTT